MKMRKIAFLDRDGTINKDYPDQEWAKVKEPELLDGTIEGLQCLKNLGYEFIVITNQYIIRDGIITEEDYRLFTDKLVSILKQNEIELLNIYYCPHNDADKCKCKKPKPGMILKAMEDFKIDMSQSIYCGDSFADQILAENMNLKFFSINMEGSNNSYRSLKEVAEKIQKMNKDNTE